MNPADLGVLEASSALRRRELSSRELTEACLARVHERDGTHSFDGDPASVNAWVRVYEEEALAAAGAADERLAAGDTPVLCGIPLGLKDLYAAAGKPLTASSRVLDEVPAEDCPVWARLSAEGMVLLGHLHTHEFAAGGTTDQVGNPWALDRSAGGSSGGSAAALASRQVPAATGTDTAGSLRIPSHCSGTSTIKPTRGLVPIDGVVPLAPTLDHAGPMARSVADCEPLLAAMAAADPPERRPLRRYAVSPRIDELDPDVADGLAAAIAAMGAERVEPPPPRTLNALQEFADLLCTEMLEYHQRFAGRRDEYRPSTRGFLEYGEQRTMTPAEVDEHQELRRAHAAEWAAWLAEHDLDAVLEPTLPVVAPLRGPGYDAAFSDTAMISLTYFWDWIGFPVVALPSGVGMQSGLPVSASLIGRPGGDWDLLAWGAALQARLGMIEP